MQPVQDLTIDTTVSRTQYQFMLEDANPDELAVMGAEAGRQVASNCRSLKMSPAICSKQGFPITSTIDRDTAGRLGITLATVDNALYDAFGQRIVSTIFTRIQPVPRDPRTRPHTHGKRCNRFICLRRGGGQVPLTTHRHDHASRPSPLQINHLGQFPAATISFNLAPGASLGDAVDAIEQGRTRSRHACQRMTSFQGAALAFRASLGNELLADSGGDRHGLYRARRSV